MGMWGWSEYVSVSVRLSRAKNEMEKLRKKGNKIEPVTIEGRTIAKKFWGKKWCEHLESFADYDSRLPRGRTYVRNGSVCHLSVQKQGFEAYVAGSSLYKISGKINPLKSDKWEAIKKRCGGQIGSILELLQGKLSSHVMEIVADEKQGLFPSENEISFKCDCPDWAGMCKHVAAVLYGIGNRLDEQPDLLFQLRGVDPSDLVVTQIDINATTTTDLLESDSLGDIFGIDIETVSPILPPTKKVKEKKPKKKKIEKEVEEPMDVNELTGASIQQFREKMRLSVAEFAESIGTTDASIYRWEGTTGPLTLNKVSRNKLVRFLESLL